MNVMTGPRWVGRKLQHLLALIQDDDHDSWLDDHPSGRKKGPDTRPFIRGGGLGGGT